MATSRTSRSSAAIAFSIALAGWALISAMGLIDPIVLPTPLSVGWAFVELFTTQGILRDLGMTLIRTLASLSVAIFVGTLCGLYLGYRSSVYRYLEGIVHAVRSVPATALFPLLLIVVGIGNLSIVVLACYPSLLVILVNTVAGVRLANVRRVHQAHTLGLSTFRILKDVLFYEALPSIFAGIRTAVSYSLVLVLAVEMFIGGADDGLGRRIFNFQARYEIPEAYASILIAALLGIVMNMLVSWAERTLLHWMPIAVQGEKSLEVVR